MSFEGSERRVVVEYQEEDTHWNARLGPGTCGCSDPLAMGVSREWVLEALLEETARSLLESMGEMWCRDGE